MSKEKNVNKSTSAPVYKSRYSDAVKNNLTKVLDGKKFSYDVNNDKLFAQYKDSYTKAGKTAMEDTVGNASALTGGYANSYAVTAGQQAYDSYMAKLNDKIPELEQRAYERYRDDEESAYKRLNTLIGLENTDYSRYRDSMSDYNTNREFEYNKSKDAQAQRNRQAQFDRDKYENDRDYNRNVYENDRKYNRDVLENDRDYNRNVYESDRDYAQNVIDSERDYRIKLNSSLRSAVKEEKDKEDDSKFSPADAYDFIKKYNEKIYTDEEFAEALFQLYGDKEGFYEWIEQMKIPGDIEDRTYLELLYKMHPELKPESWKKMGMTEDEQIMKNATNGGATPPHSQSFWWINQGQRKSR